jgi:putative ABC transport system permease protein
VIYVMHALLNDVRFALRTMRKSPGFTATVLLTLMLGIGANAAIFSVIDEVVLKPLPYPHPERLVSASILQPGDTSGMHPLGVADFLAWRDHQQSFEHVAASGGVQNVTLTGQGEPRELRSVSVTADFFPTLGVQPFMGRGFRPGDDTPQAVPVIVISEAFWKQLGAGPNVLNQSLTLNGRTYTIVGVMQGPFRYPANESLDLWRPATLEPPQGRPPYFLNAIGRLKSGVTITQAAAELKTIAAAVTSQYPQSPYTGAKVIPLQAALTQNVRSALVMLFGAVLLVLLIAIVNVANLLLARATARASEMAVRTAVGASRTRLVLQLLAESTVLSVTGGFLGLGMAAFAIQAIQGLPPSTFGQIQAAHLNWRVLSFTLCTSVVAGILLGLAPALEGSRASLHDTLRDAARGSSRRAGTRLRRVLVISEFAIAVVLLVGATMLIRSFVKLRAVDPGFEVSHVVSARISIPYVRYKEEHQVVAFWQRLTEQLRQQPGIKAVGASMSLPPDRLQITNPFTVEGQTFRKGDPLQLAEETPVTPGYFNALGVPLLKGRFIDETDRADSPRVLVINETVAKKWLPNQDPIGKRIQTGDPDPTAPYETIVGVVGDVKYQGLDAPPQPTLYVPYTEKGWSDWSRSMYLVVRSTGQAGDVTSMIREAVREVDSDIPVTKITPMSDLVDESVLQQRFRTFLLGAFAVLALLLAAIGIYGVISYSVVQQTRDIGVRIALGSTRDGVVRLVLGSTMRLALTGFGVGIVVSFFVMRLVRAFLFDVSPADPLSFAVASAVLLMAAAAAGFVPARRASAIDPACALRAE